jgi:AraC-like DNA-binding protein
MYSQFVAKTIQPFFVMEGMEFRQTVIQSDGISHIYQYRIPDAMKGNMPAIPAGMLDLVFSIGKESCHGYLCGAIGQQEKTITSGSEYVLGVRLMSGSIPGFLDVSAADMTDHEYMLSDIYSRAAELEEKIFLGKGFQERAQIVMEACRGYAEQRKRSSELVGFVRKTEHETGGTAAMRDLEQMTGFSRSYLNRQVTAELGYSVRQLRKFTRLQNMVNLLVSQPERKITDDAADCGFYDQAHCIHEFTSMMRMTPGQFRKIIRATGYQTRIQT